MDEWASHTDTPATDTSLAISYVDLPIAPGLHSPVRFTFYWTADDRWEGRNYTVEVVAD
jgi:glucoamylase